MNCLTSSAVPGRDHFLEYRRVYRPARDRRGLPPLLRWNNLVAPRERTSRRSAWAVSPE